MDFRNVEMLGFQHFELYTNSIFENVPRCFLICLGVRVSPKIEINGFGLGDAFESPEIIEMTGLRVLP